MDGWDNFFVAMAGAAVAFAGLVLVSISINLERIIKQPGLIGRSAGPLVVLFTLFTASSIILIPNQRMALYGIEMFTLGCAFTAVISVVLWRQRERAREAVDRGLSPQHSFAFRALLCVLIALALLAAGVVLATGEEKGAFFIAPAMIAGFFLAFVEAWVLLIEIDR
jgi:modulator of FtsH protease